jgi:hypothetical protein
MWLRRKWSEVSSLPTWCILHVSSPFTIYNFILTVLPFSHQEILGKELWKASQDGNITEVQRLLDNKANPNAANEVWKKYCID